MTCQFPNCPAKTESTALLYHRVVHPPYRVDPFLQHQLVELVQWQRSERTDPVIQKPISIFECERNLVRCTSCFRYVADTPMRGHRLARRYRTDFLRSTIADREHEI